MGSNSASTGGGGGGVGPAGVRVTKTGKKKYGTKSSAVATSSRNELRKAVKEFEPLPVKIIKAIAEVPKKSKQNVLDYEGQAAGVTPMRSPTYKPIDGGKDDSGNQVVQAPTVPTIPEVTAPTTAEVSQATTAVAETPKEKEDDILLRKRKAKARGRSPTILTGVTGVTGGLTLGIPSLLGR